MKPFIDIKILKTSLLCLYIILLLHNEVIHIWKSFDIWSIIDVKHLCLLTSVDTLLKIQSDWIHIIR